MTDAFSSIQYPHWLMVAGALLLALGVAGLAMRGRDVEAPSDPIPNDPPPSESEEDIEPEEPSERLTDEKRRDRWAERVGDEVAGR
jgi:hypothetical protein